MFTAYNKKQDSPESLEVNPEEDALIEQFKQEVIYKVVLSSEEEQWIFTQWLSAGRDHNELQSQIKNFYSHWCNEDMEYAADGKIKPESEIQFAADQEEAGEE